MERLSPTDAANGERGEAAGEAQGSGAPWLGRPIRTSIVVPAYNEARRMEESLPKLVDVLLGRAGDGPRDAETEVIVIDDGSTDDTVEVALAQLAELSHVELLSMEENRGKGAAVRAGVARARGDVIAFIDADMASDPRGLGSLIRSLDDSEVSIGSRVLPESSVTCWDPKRILFGRTFNHFVRVSTGLSHHDTQCGFKAFRAPAAKVLFHAATIDRYAFDVEILMLARKLGMRVREVAVDWTDIKGSHVRPFLDAVPMLSDVVRAAANWRKAPPIEAVTVVSMTNGHGGGSQELQRTIGRYVRHADPVVLWPHGAVALLPCRDSETSAAVAKRLAERLPHCRVEKSPVTIEMLLHPSATPIMEALRSLPAADGSPTILCDDPTASILLTTIGVA